VTALGAPDLAVTYLGLLRALLGVTLAVAVTPLFERGTDLLMLTDIIVFVVCLLIRKINTVKEA